MQVIGLSHSLERVDAIARRAVRPDVATWAKRVLVRHMRRTRDLHVPVPSAKAVKVMAANDGLSAEVTARILEALRAGEEIYMPDRDRIEAFIARAFDTMDFMASLPENDRRIRRIERLSWLDAEKMSEEWHASLARNRSKAANLMSGATKIAEFDDGSFVAELTTAEALRAEGDAMGHCVGGYWLRVQMGMSRIVSLRDVSGEPHATIELNRLGNVHVDGFGALSVMGGITPGANAVLPAGIDWFASQIRGKQNQFPVEKYAEKVRKWLSHAKVPSREPGFINRFEGQGFSTVYAISKEDGKGFDVFRSPDEAFTVASEEAVARLRDNPLAIVGVCGPLGLASISRDVTDSARVEALIDTIVSDVVAYIGRQSKQESVHALRAIRDSGLEKLVVASMRDRNAVLRIMGKIGEFLVSHDSDMPLESRDHVILGNVRSRNLVVRIHELPAIGLSMMNTGQADGMEDRILNGMEPKLRRIVGDMKEHPEAYHLIRPTTSGVKPDEIVQAMFACGLGAEYVKAAAFVRSGVRGAIKALNLELKTLRLAGHDVNLEKNLIGDGYEQRLERLMIDRFGVSALVIGPEPPKSMTISPSLAASYPIRTYAPPRRR
jgi:hypothetical protein|nr:PcfJ domain-containing protein [Neorhizobium tomejilense]